MELELHGAQQLHRGAERAHEQGERPAFGVHHRRQLDGRNQVLEALAPVRRLRRRSSVLGSSSEAEGGGCECEIQFAFLRTNHVSDL